MDNEKHYKVSYLHLHSRLLGENCYVHLSYVYLVYKKKCTECAPVVTAEARGLRNYINTLDKHGSMGVIVRY